MSENARQQFLGSGHVNEINVRPYGFTIKRRKRQLSRVGECIARFHGACFISLGPLPMLYAILQNGYFLADRAVQGGNSTILQSRKDGLITRRCRERLGIHEARQLMKPYLNSADSQLLKNV